MVLPGTFASPLVTMRNGSPPVCTSTVLIMRSSFTTPYPKIRYNGLPLGTNPSQVNTMSSHPITSRPSSSFWASLQSLARDMWQSYLRHSQYQVMLAGGRNYGVLSEVVRERRDNGR